jgi:Protein of unknown function (DUF3037)
MAREFGQYSVVTYIHELRGERINLGVLVWHPVLGGGLKLARNFQRVRCIDDTADLERVRQACEQIQATMKACELGGPSPLFELALQFRHRLVVTPPMNARVHDPLATLERLSASLLAKEPFMRASTTTQFAKAFVAQLVEHIRQRGVTDVRASFSEEDTFQPVTIAACYNHASAQYLWRAFSFASLDRLDDQMTAAKAIYAENADLQSLPKYRLARLQLAVQLPKPQSRADWAKARAWLERGSDEVVSFEDRQSLEEKVPKLLAA